jgi:hypothetical protein
MTLRFAVKAGDEELKAECYGRLAHLHLLLGRYDLMSRLLAKSMKAATRADSHEFALYEQLLRAEWETAKGELVAGRLFAEALAEASEVGLVYYQLWAGHGLARLSQMEGSVRKSVQGISTGMAKARLSGYRWWELRFAELGTHDSLPNHIRVRCLARSTTLVREIESGIGDPSVRSRFDDLPLIRSVRSIALGSPIGQSATERFPG